MKKGKTSSLMEWMGKGHHIWFKTDKLLFSKNTFKKNNNSLVVSTFKGKIMKSIIVAYTCRSVLSTSQDIIET